MNTRLTLVTLAMFALCFSHDARRIKDAISLGLSDQRNINKQWVNLFKKLPIGMVVIYDKEVIHKNKKMFDVTGETNLKV